MYEKWQKILGVCSLFQGVDPNEMPNILGCLRPRIESYKKNELVTIEGDIFTGIGVVLSGEMIVTKENVAGNRVIMEIISPGEMFGEMSAFSGEGVWPATVVAQVNSTAMFLASEKIAGECEKLCPSHRLLVINMLKIISNKAIRLNTKVEYLSMKSMRGKISTFLLEQYKRTGKNTFMMPLKRDELADFLNVSRPSLSREMGRMRDEGIIEFHRASIKLKDITALRRMVET
ncbi:MAG: Crp/Fnr family transcriptional regulator [Bacillota bacterium]|jgi:CRP-like cAMP-binding protein